MVGVIESVVSGLFQTLKRPRPQNEKNDAVLMLLNLYLNEANRPVIARAIPRGIARIPGVIPAIFAVFSNDEASLEVRMVAARALEVLKIKASSLSMDEVAHWIPALVEMLRMDLLFAQERAAKILQELSSDPRTRSLVLRFPGLVPELVAACHIESMLGANAAVSALANFLLDFDNLSVIGAVPELIPAFVVLMQHGAVYAQNVLYALRYLLKEVENRNELGGSFLKAPELGVIFLEQIKTGSLYVQDCVAEILLYLSLESENRQALLTASWLVPVFILLIQTEVDKVHISVADALANLATESESSLFIGVISPDDLLSALAPGDAQSDDGAGGDLETVADILRDWVLQHLESLLVVPEAGSESQVSTVVFPSRVGAEASSDLPMP